MPELPDVENYKRYLDATALNKEIAGVSVNSAKVLDGVSGRSLRQRLRGRRFTGTRRHGKHLFVTLDRKGVLVLHFGMTGRLAYFEDEADDPKYDRVRFDLADGRHLAYDCRRQIGRIGFADSVERFVAERELGPDALDPSVDAGVFAGALSGRRGGVKSALMNQSLFAGVGNVYSDEALYRAGIAPQAALADLDRETLKSLYRALVEVLRTAIERGAGTDEVTERIPRTYLLPHRREGAECPRCGGTVRKATVAGRSSYYCPDCQRLGAR